MVSISADGVPTDSSALKEKRQQARRHAKNMEGERNGFARRIGLQQGRTAQLMLALFGGFLVLGPIGLLVR